MRSCLARTLGRGAPSRSSQSLGRHLSLNVRTMLTAPVSVHVGAVQTCLCNFQTGALHHPSISGVLISHCASAALPARLHAARRRAKSHSTHPNMSARPSRAPRPRASIPTCQPCSAGTPADKNRPCSSPCRARTPTAPSPLRPSPQAANGWAAAPSGGGCERALCS